MSFRYECKNNLLLVSWLCYFFFVYNKQENRKQKALFLSQTPDINRGTFKKSVFKMLYAVFVRVLQFFSLSHLWKDAFTKPNKQIKMLFKIMQNDLIFPSFILIWVMAWPNLEKKFTAPDRYKSNFKETYQSNIKS